MDFCMHLMHRKNLRARQEEAMPVSMKDCGWKEKRQRRRLRESLGREMSLIFAIARQSRPQDSDAWQHLILSGFLPEVHRVVKNSLRAIKLSSDQAIKIKRWQAR